MSRHPVCDHPGLCQLDTDRPDPGRHCISVLSAGKGPAEVPSFRYSLPGICSRAQILGGGFKRTAHPKQNDPGICSRSPGCQPSGRKQMGKRHLGPKHLQPVGTGKALWHPSGGVAEKHTNMTKRLTIIRQAFSYFVIYFV